MPFEWQNWGRLKFLWWLRWFFFVFLYLYFSFLLPEVCLLIPGQQAGRGVVCGLSSAISIWVMNNPCRLESGEQSQVNNKQNTGVSEYTTRKVQALIFLNIFFKTRTESQFWPVSHWLKWRHHTSQTHFLKKTFMVLRDLCRTKRDLYLKPNEGRNTL